MKFKIRKATSNSDFESILALNKALFDYENQFTNQWNNNWTYSDTGKRYFEKRITNDQSIALVAEQNKEIVGYLVAFIDNYAFRAKNPICELENMFIKEEYRNNGIGSALIDQLKKELKKKGVPRLKVAALANNKKALSFYKYNGFSEFVQFLEMDL